MKRQLLILAVCLFTSSVCFAQDYPTEVINGKVVYRYKVKKAEGLWRISQNFGVTQEEIIELNPQISKTGLRYDEEIYIPAKNKNVDDAQQQSSAKSDGTAATPAAPNADNNSQRIHHVKKGETLYSLSRYYGVTVADIENANPEVKKKGLKADRDIIIPAPTQPTTVTNRQEDTETKTSEPQTTPATTEEKTQETKKTNNDLSKFIAFGIDNFMQLFDTTMHKAANGVDRWANSNDNEPMPVDSSMFALPLRIAYMLPFCANTNKRDVNNNRFLEFYEGALLACKTLQDNGQPLELYVYDTDKGETNIQDILSRPEMRNADAIIGPAYPAQVNIVAQYAKENKIPMLIPFTSKVSDIQNNPYLIQFNPTDQLTTKAITDYLRQQEFTTKVFFISTPYTDFDNINSELQAQLKAAHLSFTELQSTVIDNDSLTNYLSDNSENLIFFDTDKQAAVGPLAKALKKNYSDYQITLFGKQTWKSQDIALPFIYSTIFNSDDNSLLMTSYRILFERYFHHPITTAAPRYDLLGYDLTTYLCRLLQQGNEKTLSQRVGTIEYKGLQSDIQCRPISSTGGCINTNIEIK